MYHLWNTFIGYIRINYSTIPWILLFAVVFFAVFEMLHRSALIQFRQAKGWKVFLQGVLSVACSTIFVLSLFGRQRAEYGMNLIPFVTYIDAFEKHNSEILLQHFMNVAIYIPIGFLLPCCFKSVETWKRVLLTVFICSVGIELIQGIAKIGYLEADDVVNNMLGTVIGKGIDTIYKYGVAFSGKRVEIIVEE